LKIYHQEQNEEIAESIISMLEKDTAKKVFTLKIIGEDEKGLEAVIVFEDKSIMMAFITVQEIAGKLACRLQANWI
jgi:hypothetical protein